MAVRRQTGLDLAASALTRHLRAVADRQAKNPSGELSAADLASVVRAAEVLRTVEWDHVNLALKVLGRRINTIDKDELVGFFAKMRESFADDSDESEDLGGDRA
jgi:mRNA-degrading endonuclease toxin of MazEF toxin-antitoxin module